MISEQLRNPLSMFDVRGKSAIITGATGAFGRGIALVLASLGANVTLAGASQDELEKVAEEVRSLGGQAVTVACRPDSLDDAERMLNAALEAFDRVDQLVIGSGFNKAGFIDEMDYADWQKVMDANVRGAWFMAKAVGSYWIKSEVRGKMLLMSSVRGRHWKHFRLHRILHLERGNRRADAGARDGMGQVWHYGQRYRADSLPLQPDRMDVRR